MFSFKINAIFYLFCRHIYKITLNNFWVSYIFYIILFYGFFWFSVIFFIYLFIIDYMPLATINLEYAIDGFMNTHYAYAMHSPIITFGLFPTTSWLFQGLITLMPVLEMPFEKFEFYVQNAPWDSPYHLSNKDFKVYLDIYFSVTAKELFFTALCLYISEYELINVLLNFFSVIFLFYNNIFCYLLFFFLILHCIFSLNHIFKDYLRNINLYLYIFYFNILSYLFFRLTSFLLYTGFILNSVNSFFIIVFFILFIFVSNNKLNILSNISYIINTLIVLLLFIYIYYVLLFLQQYLFCFSIALEGYLWVTWLKLCIFKIFYFNLNIFSFINIINMALLHFFFEKALFISYNLVQLTFFEWFIWI